MFWGFTIIYQNDNGITAFCNMAPKAIIIVNIADYPATAMIVYDYRVGIAGRPQMRQLMVAPSTGISTSSDETLFGPRATPYKFPYKLNALLPVLVSPMLELLL